VSELTEIVSCSIGGFHLIRKNNLNKFSGYGKQDFHFSLHSWLARQSCKITHTTVILFD